MWEQFQRLKHPKLWEMTEQIPSFVRKMKNPKTAVVYTQAFRRFERWSSQFKELTSFPTEPHTVALYLMELTRGQKSHSTVKPFLASIKWLHELAGYDDPTGNTLVKVFIQSAFRQLAAPVVHKTPVTKEMLVKLHDKLFVQNVSNSLKDTRDFLYILLSFTGFLRFDEASRVRRSDVKLHEDFLSVKIPKSKTDQFCKGEDILIARSSTDLCTLTWMVRYLVRGDIPNSDSRYIFRAVFKSAKSGSTGLRASDKPLSYSYLAQMFKDRLTSNGYQAEKITLHSLRAGGVTRAMNEGVAYDRCKTHGRWKSDAVDSYVTESLENKLTVSRGLDM